RVPGLDLREQPAEPRPEVHRADQYGASDRHVRMTLQDELPSLFRLAEPKREANDRAPAPGRVGRRRLSIGRGGDARAVAAADSRAERRGLARLWTVAASGCRGGNDPGLSPLRAWPSRRQSPALESKTKLMGK